MTGVTHLSDHRPFPDLSVAEFAVLIALLRAGPHPAGFLIPTLDSWFDTKLCVADLEPTIARLIRANLILRRGETLYPCLLYTSPSPRDRQKSRMPSSA